MVPTETYSEVWISDFLQTLRVSWEWELSSLDEALRRAVSKHPYVTRTLPNL